MRSPPCSFKDIDESMNKKLAHSILVLGDIFCFWGLWIVFRKFQLIHMEITNNADMIRFSSRISFLVVGIFLPSAHLLTLIEYFRPSLIDKNKRFLNQSSIIALVVLVLFGFTGSSWIKTKVEKAGYICCSEAGGAGALVRSYVYTRNMNICDKIIVEEFNQGR